MVFALTYELILTDAKKYIRIPEEYKKWVFVVYFG